MSDVAAETVHAFFNPGLTGSLFNRAAPIWHELSFKLCADEKVYPYDGDPMLLSSHMPDQYLYLDDKAIDQSGSYTDSSQPIKKGDFKAFSAIFDVEGHGLPYGDCKPGFSGGNPWGIGVENGAGANPPGHFCSWPSTTPDPEYSG